MIAALVVVIIVLYIVYTWWQSRKQHTTVIKDDQGNTVSVSAADISKARALAARIHEDISGIPWVRDDEAYIELAAQSNVVFALVFQYYQDDFGASLIADINGEWMWGDILDSILARASSLNLK